MMSRFSTPRPVVLVINTHHHPDHFLGNQAFAGLPIAATEAGLDMNGVLARPLPAEFAALPVAASEYRRSVSHLFPAAEQRALR